MQLQVWCVRSNGKDISQTGLKADNVENPIFFLPNLDISAALRIYQLLKDTGPVPKISRKEDHVWMVWRDTYVSRTRKWLSGDRKPGGWIGEKNRILSLYEAKTNQNRGADSFLHPHPVGALIQFCIVR